MKKIKFLTVIAAMLIFCSSFKSYKPIPVEDPKYVVAIAREQKKSGGKNQPVVTNVFYFNCDGRNSKAVETQLQEYYNAYYKNSRGAMYIKDELEFSYDTKAAAEKKRTELIAKYRDNGDDVLLIDRFSVSCD
jgi:hypothetical protein